MESFSHLATTFYIAANKFSRKYTMSLKLCIFTARRVCIARTMPWQDVRLSVRPSVRLSHAVLSLNGYTYPKSFSPSGSPTILVFPYQTRCQYSDGTPLTGASNARGYEKITILDQYRFISELVQDRAIVTMEKE